MAGGKETPRQKMIGMMYIVLTALLALNVSKTILDAFVAIEENIQLGNINEYNRGFEKISMIKNKMAENDLRAKFVYTIVQKVDKETAEVIQLIDEAKLKVLAECKEKVKVGAGEEADASILVRDDERPKLSLSADGLKVSNNAVPVLPLRFKLAWVDGKDKYDEPMRVMGISKGEQLVVPDANQYGMKIWNKMIKYREELINNICEASAGLENIDKSKDSAKASYTFKDPKIVKFSNKKDLLKQFKGSLSKVKIDDYDIVEELYFGLVKNQKVKEGDKMLHWVGKTFDHAPSVAVLASLSSLQKEILSARAAALSELQEKVGGGDFSFNTVVAIARPNNMIVSGNSEFLVSVSMGAFDSENQPLVVPNGGVLFGAPQNGVQLLKYKAPASGSVKITGSVGIKKKNGKMETRFYGNGSDGQKPLEVMVVPPMGSVMLPEYNILYQGYGNKVVAVASQGETDISISGPASKGGKTSFTIDGVKYNGWTVTPSATGSVSIVVNGKDGDGKTVKMGGPFNYKVKPFPKPEITSTKISAAGGMITVGLPQSSVINCSFQTVGLSTEDGFSTTGNTLPRSAIKVKPGKSMTISVRYRNLTTGVVDTRIGSISIIK